MKDMQLINRSEHLMKLEEDGYVFLCVKSDLQENIGRKFIINDIEIAVFKINSEIFALSNTCPHQQTRLIYDGFVEDEFVVCPAHGWKFNLRTGKKDSGSNGLQVYPVEVVDDKIYVKVSPKELRW
ncbi:MAG: 3-phenylpropionate/cinnamic acid dioxygenase ferredoxin subunit [Ignavibacteriaceae bacterium]|jgi:nitrite reductase/ring-hydroxylating ferredoxin subunit|nr:MAG: Rieske (2Fe-2S) protein [Chlorobiota bacterium]MBL1121933.1 Rieske (2Fe-2S) protein [Ignavibacteriota bacterium]MBV6422188.1 3-phenylpropionate/cinnamic acid dioxygenase ferredoxin subunit [Ignavibacteriaceae bacterium]MCE7855592.1 Rieske (2Fe-2S) protein [Ignavibacteria bacterium CHB3]